MIVLFSLHGIHDLAIMLFLDIPMKSIQIHNSKSNNRRYKAFTMPNLTIFFEQKLNQRLVMLVHRRMPGIPIVASV